MSTIKVGVIGIGRGKGFARGAGSHLGMELVALCDRREEALTNTARELGVESYVDYDEFLEHDMDAVILANYFHEHAPFAVKALRAGKHVMSETTPCMTLAQGVELVREVERSGRIYMFAENYPYSLHNQEMRRLYQAGEVGQFMYGEGEYVHPMDGASLKRLAPGVDHWRNWIPSTYYCTHALAPIMYVTDTWPVKVNGFVIQHRNDDPVNQRSIKRNDASSMIALRMNNGAVAKLLQVYLRGDGIWVRIHGSRGQVERVRHGSQGMIRLRQERYHEEEEAVDRTYAPEFPTHHEEATRSGHGGGDFWMNFSFSEAIRTGEQPYLDVYRGVTMSAVGILAYRSALQDSAPLAIPDFRQESARLAYENDHWNPDPTQRKEGDPWPSVRGDITPSPEALAEAREIWREMGYTGV